MPRNIEIKAKVKHISKLLETAEKLSVSKCEILKQRDVFFNAKNGRLKLRSCSEKSDSELIYYDRPDSDGPKLSTYERCCISNTSQLESVLTSALGVRGIVEKTRHLFLVGQTRIHIDIVENLGDFMELEVVLTDDQTLEEGQSIAESLMSELGVQKEDLIAGAYMDLLLERN